MRSLIVLTFALITIPSLYVNCAGLSSQRELSDGKDDYVEQLSQIIDVNQLPTSPLVDLDKVKTMKISLNTDGSMDLFVQEGSTWTTHLSNKKLLIKDLLQPAIDTLHKNGGGKIFLSSEDRGGFVFSPEDSERVYLKSGVSIEGLKSKDNTFPQISINKKMGNVFFIDNQTSVQVRGLRIEAKRNGNYVFSMRRPINVTLEDIEILYPEATGFGHISGTNTSYIRCRVIGDNPYRGHGFALSGNDGVVQDTNTTLVDSVAKGFAHPEGGQGVQFRPPLPSYGADPLKLNFGIKVIGGEYSNNLVGVWLQGADQALIRGAALERNSMYGVFIHSPLENAEIVPNRVQIENSNIRWNGSNSRPHAGVMATRANVTIIQSSFDGNEPFHLITDGSNIATDTVNFYTTLGRPQPYNASVTENPVASSLTFINSSLGPTLYESIENQDQAVINFK